MVNIITPTADPGFLNLRHRRCKYQNEDDSSYLGCDAVLTDK
jgi:hypothetical protein